MKKAKPKAKKAAPKKKAVKRAKEVIVRWGAVRPESLKDTAPNGKLFRQERQAKSFAKVSHLFSEVVRVTIERF